MNGTLPSCCEVYDDVLDDFLGLWRHAIWLDFSGVTNPEDGVTYPDCSTDVPKEVVQELSKKVGIREVHYAFFRLTTKYTEGAPHQAHTDTRMGPRSLMLYMHNGPGGTSFVRHRETGVRTEPTNSYMRKVWERDTNRPDAWEIYAMAEMKENRVVTFPSKLMHRAEPIGGFGTSPTDGRLVLTMFYTPQDK